MLNVRQQSSSPTSAEPMKMEADDLDMSDLTMDEIPETSKTHKHE
jgi:hypothetical protein